MKTNHLASRLNVFVFFLLLFKGFSFSPILRKEQLRRYSMVMRDSQISRAVFSDLVVTSIFGTALFDNTRNSLAVDASVQSTVTNPAQSNLTITHKVFFEVRIASVLNASNNYSSYKDFRGKLVFGLYGNDAPKSVEKILSFINSEDEDQPSYATGLFLHSTPGVTIDGGKINGLNTVMIAGAPQYEYRGRVVSLATAVESSPVKHYKRGLLTRDCFDNGPEFSITLAKAPALDDRKHVVFGELIEGEDVLQKLEAVPLYSARSVEPEGSLADKWYQAQKRFFLNAGTLIGDDRAVDLTGRLLRRVDITQFGVIKEDLKEISTNAKRK